MMIQIASEISSIVPFSYPVLQTRKQNKITIYGAIEWTDKQTG